MDGLRELIERRINIFGVREPEIEVVGENRISVKLPGIKDPKEAIKEIGKTPYLEFKEELSKSEREKIIKEKLGDQAKDISPDTACLNPVFINQFIKQFKTDPCYKPTELNGRYLKRAELGFDPRTYEPVVNLVFDSKGSKLFAKITEKNVGKPLAIYIDNVLISAPRVREKITGGKAQISGKFTLEEAKKLAENLNAGALPVPIHLIAQKTIGPTLGMISFNKSLKAGFYGFLAIILFLVIFYKLPGLLSSLALFIYVILTLTLFKIIPVTLTLAGIGGFILSIGMAVDANILIFSRMREELDKGESFSRSIDEGFRRAWPSIRDGNATTLIVALILFVIGTSFVKGFATTLILGILSSLFAAMIVTRTLLNCFRGTRFEKIKWLWR